MEIRTLWRYLGGVVRRLILLTDILEVRGWFWESP